VVRYQGGNNAGHTLYVDGQKIVLHQIPSGIFHAGQQCALTAGVVVNPAQMVAEIEKVSRLVAVNPERLWLSVRAHVISPWHIHRDSHSEASEERPIGTTRRGIGPTYADKAARIGLRLGEFVDDARRLAWCEGMRRRILGFQAFEETERDSWSAFHAAAPLLRTFVCDAEARLRRAIYDGRPVLLEGAQGGLLDIDHGTYPYVTSSATAAGGALASLGFSPKRIGAVLGVAKAYVTRVGEGPMPTELKDTVGAHLAHQGKEFGATTGRPRRCGWLDAVALRYSCEMNGFDGIILNKMDILNGLSELKIATSYQHPRLGQLTEFPWDPEVLRECVPQYLTLPGWAGEIPQEGNFADLPHEAQDYVRAVEAAVIGRVTMIGTGVSRNHFLGRG
jgi:adenylosuccinate synthase